MMKDVLKIALGVLLGNLALEAVHLLEVRTVLVGAGPRSEQSGPAPVLASPPVPAASATPPPAAAPSQPPKPCEIKRADGTVIHCQGPLIDSH